MIRNQIIVPCMTVELSSWLSASKRCFMTSRVGMYLNWNRSRRNTDSTAHMHTQIRNCMSVRIVAWAQNKGTHDAEVRPCRAQHLSQNTSLATNQSLFQGPVPAQPRKFAHRTADHHPHCVTFGRSPSVAQISPCSIRKTHEYGDHLLQHLHTPYWQL